MKNTVVAAMEFSRYARAFPQRDDRLEAGLSKLNSVERRGRRNFQAAWQPDGAEAPSTGQEPTGVIAPEFPRKEVIQPQLPLRLPCYDFTPITNPTFDGSLPCGLGHRLRVLPAFVV